jgi:hypothetical protein
MKNTHAAALERRAAEEYARDRSGTCRDCGLEPSAPGLHYCAGCWPLNAPPFRSGIGPPDPQIGYVRE